MGKWTTIAEAAIELLSKKGGGALPDTTLPIRPARENLRTVVDSNTIGGRVSGDEMLPIDSLSGGPSLSARGQKAVDDIVEQMSGPDGFIERLIVDQDNNVIEGAHRVEALRRLGIEQVPITRVVDPTANLDLPKMGEAINAVGPIHSDHVNQITAQVGDMLAEVGGDPAKVLQEFDLPKGFERFFRAALDSVSPKALPTDEAAPVVPRLLRDNPGAKDPEFYGPGGWLGSKIRKAAEKRASATPYTTNATLGGMDGVTGFFRERLKIRPEALRDIKGAMGEERFAGGEKLQRLEDSIAKEGYLDDSPIMIAVREDGVPFIVEGNNRVQEAIKSGRPHINVEIQYLRGAEDVEGPLSPGNLPSVMARAQETKLPK